MTRFISTLIGRILLVVVLLALTPCSGVAAAPPQGSWQSRWTTIRADFYERAKEREAILQLSELLASAVAPPDATTMDAVNKMLAEYYGQPTIIGTEAESNRFQIALLNIFRLTGNVDATVAFYGRPPWGRALFSDANKALERWRTPKTCEIRLLEPRLPRNGQWVKFTAKARNEVGVMIPQPRLTFQSSDSRIMEISSESKIVRAGAAGGRASIQARFGDIVVCEQDVDTEIPGGGLPPVGRVIRFGAAPVETTVFVSKSVDKASLRAEVDPDSLLGVSVTVLPSDNVQLRLWALRPGQGQVRLEDLQGRRTGDPFRVVVPPEMDVKVERSSGNLRALEKSRGRFLTVTAGDSIWRLGLQPRWKVNGVARLAGQRVSSQFALEYELAGLHTGTTELELLDASGQFHAVTVVNVEAPSTKMPLVVATLAGASGLLAVMENSKGDSKHDEAQQAAEQGLPTLADLNDEADSHYQRATILMASAGAAAVVDFFLWRRFVKAGGKFGPIGGGTALTALAPGTPKQGMSARVFSLNLRF